MCNELRRKKIEEVMLLGDSLRTRRSKEGVNFDSDLYTLDQHSRLVVLSVCLCVND